MRLLLLPLWRQATSPVRRKRCRLAIAVSRSGGAWVGGVRRPRFSWREWYSNEIRRAFAFAFAFAWAWGSGQCARVGECCGFGFCIGGVRISARWADAAAVRPVPGGAPGGAVTSFASPKEVTKKRRPHLGGYP